MIESPQAANTTNRTNNTNATNATNATAANASVERPEPAAKVSCLSIGTGQWGSIGSYLSMAVKGINEKPIYEKGLLLMDTAIL